jgi:prepilin-type N-terminal cleavage/methylation domain-containing protein
MWKKMKTLRGFTLSEILIVVTIIAILAIIVLISLQRQTIRGFDAKRKADFSKLRVIFEDYYNDKNEYPSMGDWNTNYDSKCIDGGGSQFLAPYLQGQNIPCDPVTNKPYLYITVDSVGKVDGAIHSRYKLLASLGNLQDPDIPGSGCSPDPTKGCGYVESDCEHCSPIYNYGISIGGDLANPAFDSGASLPMPTSAFPPGNWICPKKIGNQPPQNCQYYSDSCRDLMITRGCVTYNDAHK